MQRYGHLRHNVQLLLTPQICISWQYFYIYMTYFSFIFFVNSVQTLSMLSLTLLVLANHVYRFLVLQHVLLFQHVFGIKVLESVISTAIFYVVVKFYSCLLICTQKLL